MDYSQPFESWFKGGKWEAYFLIYCAAPASSKTPFFGPKYGQQKSRNEMTLNPSGRRSPDSEALIETQSLASRLRNVNSSLREEHCRRLYWVVLVVVSQLGWVYLNLQSFHGCSANIPMSQPYFQTTRIAKNRLRISPAAPTECWPVGLCWLIILLILH